MNQHLETFKKKLSEAKEKIQGGYRVFCAKGRKCNNGFLSWFHRHDVTIYLVIITLLGIVMRILLFPCVRGDYTGFLVPWYKNIYLNGAAALGEQFGDYTPAYNYFLYLISRMGFVPEETFQIGEFVIDPVLWEIKTISCLFDFGIAIFVYFIAKELTSSRLKAVLCYAAIVFGLTVFLNSALWGQCDAIYVFFLIGSIFFLLRNKQPLSFFFLGLSFCFKLQAIFVLPALLVLYFKKQVKLRYILLVPLVYLIVALPAAFCGEDFFARLGEIFMVYPNQMANGYSQVTLNAGTFYALIFTNFKDENFISTFGIFLCLAVNGTLIFLLQRYKKPFEGKDLVKLFFVFAMTMPYFMPHMHERYFYLADILVVLYVLLNAKRFYVYILAMLNSMIGYMVYLWNVPFFNVVPQDGTIPDNTKALSFRLGALLYLAAIVFVLKDFFSDLNKADKEYERERLSEETPAEATEGQ